tara:strand:+ start:300 stop:491 length:192 start_codon:yes stop_codon:yes gene_type:complete
MFLKKIGFLSVVIAKFGVRVLSSFVREGEIVGMKNRICSRELKFLEVSKSAGIMVMSCKVIYG